MEIKKIETKTLKNTNIKIGQKMYISRNEKNIKKRKRIRKLNGNKGRRGPPAVHGGRFVAVFTAHNKRYTLRRLIGGSGFRSPRSLRSHGSLHPHFANPGLCYAKPLFGFAKRRIPRTLGASF